MTEQPILIATRGSALALAQANMVLAECRKKFPKLAFELKIIKTTGDKLQSASMSRIDASLPTRPFHQGTGSRRCSRAGRTWPCIV